ncbi:probable serine/threonine-protein kinase pats1 [Saccostrea echinata]|uniref:probable serine/threonine-protein kinase pats1 n=1 Tax=Saccostrea echinata TaxID=191078 RepID=UPI002A83CA84|nr:probable serine/threonine-protein kinase pats1 [Saccostrea echinata]
MDTFSDTIDEMEKQDKNITVEKETKVFGFKSDNVRHQVMGYFVMNCLRTDEDYESYIKLSSVDSLLEYVRNWRYSKGENKRCLYLPEKMEDALIKRLGLAAIIHVMMDEGDYDNDNCNEERRRKVISNVKVPRELFDWDYDARSRYVECARKGTQIIHRARAMIVGCAGAGKTTLLKRLQRKKLEEITDVKSTVGLEVHEDIFEVSQDQDSLRALTDESNKEGKTLLSVLDFGGQCAYYACHQVYLSRRAFYILVIDMSKSFKDKVDKALCDQEGTMFGDWTYGEYLLFWMKSIHFYCAKDVPVILVGTHLDRSEHQTSDEFYRRILDHLRHDENLKVHLNRKRCFIIGFRENDEQCLDQFLDLEKCIVSIAKEDRWKETIPRDWAICEVILRKLKSTERMLSRKAVSSEFLYYIQEKSTNVQDVLKLFHDIGIILHFDEQCLSETIVIDIQWFVDAFKNIITDPNHALDLVRDHEEWMNFYQNGYLSNLLLQKIWKSRRLDNSTQKSILQYMQRLD